MTREEKVIKALRAYGVEPKEHGGLVDDLLWVTRPMSPQEAYAIVVELNAHGLHIENGEIVPGPVT
jgi:hypothetical protein